MAPHLFRGLRPRAPSFDGSVPAHGTDGHRFAHRRAGGGETFFSRIGAILFGGSWASPAQTRVTFCSCKK